jgi:hypothetical protein
MEDHSNITYYGDEKKKEEMIVNSHGLPVETLEIPVPTRNHARKEVIRILVSVYICKDRRMELITCTANYIVMAVEEFLSNKREKGIYFVPAFKPCKDHGSSYHMITTAFILSWINKEKKMIAIRKVDNTYDVILFEELATDTAADDMDSPDDPFDDANFGGSIELTEEGIFHYYSVYDEEVENEEDGKQQERKKIAECTYSTDRICMIES